MGGIWRPMRQKQVAFSHALQPGYGDQPPLYNWLFYCFGKSLRRVGRRARLPLKNATLLVSCVFSGLPARKVAGGRDTAWICRPLVLLSLPAVFLLAQRDLTHQHRRLRRRGVLPGRAGADGGTAVGGELRASRSGCRRILAKYNFAIIPVAAVVALLLEPGTAAIGSQLAADGDHRGWSRRCGPHVYWVVTHLDTATGDTLTKMRAAASHEAPQPADGRLAVAGIDCQMLRVDARRLRRRLSRASPHHLRRVQRMDAGDRPDARHQHDPGLRVHDGCDATLMRPKWTLTFFVAFPPICVKADAAGCPQKGPGAIMQVDRRSSGP